MKNSQCYLTSHLTSLMPGGVQFSSVGSQEEDAEAEFGVLDVYPGIHTCERKEEAGSDR